MAGRGQIAEQKRLKFPFNVHWKCGIMIQRPVGFLTMPELLEAIGWPRNTCNNSRLRASLRAMMTPTCALSHLLPTGTHTHFIRFMPWPCVEFIKRVEMVGGWKTSCVANWTYLPDAVPIQEIRHASTIPTLGALMFVLWALEINMRHAIVLGEAGGLLMTKAARTVEKLLGARQRIVKQLLDEVNLISNERYRRRDITVDPVRVKEIWRIAHTGLYKKE